MLGDRGGRTLGPFTAGVNNIDGETDVPKDALRESVNVDITRSGSLKRRSGYTQLQAMTNSHSLYPLGSNSVLYVEGSDLKTIPLDNLEEATPTTLDTVTDQLAYASVLGTVYYTDNVKIARVLSNGTQKLAWVPNPAGNPTVVDAGGSLIHGKYQVAITNIGSDGEESGTDIAVPVTVTSGGITLTNIPQTADAQAVRVYLTTVGGDTFYAQYDVPMGTTTFTMTSMKASRALETQWADAMPAGQALCYHYGRLYVAVGNMLVFSEALRYGLTRLMDNYLPFGSDIKVVMSHTTGMFIVADKTYFIPGSDPDNAQLREVYPHSAVAGTGAYVPASILGLESPGTAPYWFSDNGAVVGTDNGEVLPLMEKKVSVGQYETGATLYREEDGMRSLITSLQETEQPSILVATDSVSFELRRNGIPVPP